MSVHVTSCVGVIVHQTLSLDEICKLWSNKERDDVPSHTSASRCLPHQYTLHQNLPATNDKFKALMGAGCQLVGGSGLMVDH